MLWLLTLGLAFAGQWDGAESDVLVERTIAADPDRIVAALDDLRVLAQMFPEDCASDWAFGTQTAGVGAVARVTYRIGSMKRRLTARLTTVEAGRLIELDHDTDRGWVTQVRVTQGEEGATVLLGTWVTPPPAPFKGLYFTRIRPAWLDCHERTLDNLEAWASVYASEAR